MNEPLEMSINEASGCADIFAGIVDIGIIYYPSMARDIVARFNACKGIATADLERVERNLTPIFDLLMQTARQRDDLLAAAEELLSHKLPDGVRGGRLILEADCLNLDAIVARVKGGAA